MAMVYWSSACAFRPDNGSQASAAMGLCISCRARVGWGIISSARDTVWEGSEPTSNGFERASVLEKDFDTEVTEESLTVAGRVPDSPLTLPGQRVTSTTPRWESNAFNR